METALIFFALSVVGVLLYFNVVTTIILARDPTVARLTKRFQIAIVWLLPIFGFAIALRFSFQSNPTSMHEKLIPSFVGGWIYDETIRKANENRDDSESNERNMANFFDR